MYLVARMLKKDAIYSIQALRAIAASLVVVLHSYVYLEARNIIPNVPNFVNSGRAGVDIFFVISGFIMIYISGKDFGVKGKAGRFITKRIIRIVPIYWFYTMVMATLLFVFPYLFSQGKTFSLGHLLASLSFVPWPNSIGQIKPILSVGWTLNFEMYFYIIFSMLLLLQKKYFIPLLAIFLLSGFIIGLLYKPQSSIFYVITSPLLIEFLYGSIIGIYYKRGLMLSTNLCVFLITCGTTLLFLTGIYDFGDIPREIKWGFSGALLVTGFVFLERNGQLVIPSWLVELGGSSYSLYLTHIFIINATGKIWVTVFGMMYDVFVIVAILSSIVAGHIAYILFEKPLTAYLNNIYHRYSQ